MRVSRALVPAQPAVRGMLDAVSSIRSRAWRQGVEVAADFPLADLDTWLGRDDVLVWLDILAPSPADLDVLRDELGMDQLAVEDAVEPMERPKATRHANHSFLTCYSTALEEGARSTRLVTGRVSAFLLKDGLITVRPDDTVDMDAILHRWQEDGLLHSGVAALVHGLLDHLVDGHFAAIGQMDDELEDLEDLLFESNRKPAELQQRVFAMRKALVELRRVVLPMREVVTSVMRFRAESDRPLSSDLDGNFNDLYDHVIRAAEWTESLRDMVSSIFETQLSLQDARLNEVMKKLAGWGAIIAVPTAITGWFGQNLPYPGFSDTSGLIQSVVLILVGSVGLFAVFRKFDWI